MKRTEFKKHAAALLLMLCLLAVSALPAFATSANIKLTDRNGDPMTGTIRVRLYDEASQKALRGGELTIYRVAEVQRKNGDLSFEYCGDFYGCGIELGDLNDLGDSSLAACWTIWPRVRKARCRPWTTTATQSLKIWSWACTSWRRPRLPQATRP